MDTYQESKMDKERRELIFKNIDIDYLDNNFKNIFLFSQSNNCMTSNYDIPLNFLDKNGGDATSSTKLDIS